MDVDGRKGTSSALRLLEDLSSREPFGSSRWIGSRSVTHYGRAIAWVEGKLGRAEKPDALWRAIARADASLRWFALRSGPIRAVTDELCTAIFNRQAESDPESVQRPYEDLRNALAGLRQEDSPSRVALGAFDLQRPLTEPFPFVVSAWEPTATVGDWSESRAVEDLFDLHMADAVGVEPSVLRPFPGEACAQLEGALDFLQRVSPLLIQDVVMNVRHFCYIDFARWRSMDDDDYREIGQSVSSHLVPSCCFLSVHAFASMPKLIEAVYHESLHKKLSNLLWVKDILREGFDPDRAPKFFSYWNKFTKWNSNQWEFDRALFAFHLYAHLVVLYSAVRGWPDSEEMPREWVIGRFEASRERARALRDWLLANAGDHVGTDGLPFIEFIDEIMESPSLTS